MSGRAEEGSASSFPATFKEKSLSSGKTEESLCYCRILEGYLEQQCPPCCLFHLAEDGLADSSREKTNLAKVGKDEGYMDLLLALDALPLS